MQVTQPHHFLKIEFPDACNIFFSMGFLLIFYDFGNPDQQNALSTICTLCALCKVVIILQSSQLMFSNPINRIGRNKNLFLYMQTLFIFIFKYFFSNSTKQRNGLASYKRASRSASYIRNKRIRNLENSNVHGIPISVNPVSDNAVLVCVCVSFYI